MFKKTLLPDTIRAVKLVSKIDSIKESYLAGGTALALHLGHRISIDLDFFTPKIFNETTLSQQLQTLPGYKEDGTAWRTIWGRIGDTKFSIFYYKYPLIKKSVEFGNIRVASKEDIAAMKIHALEERGTKRDFIYLYFLAKEFSLEQMLDFYNKKYDVLNKRLYMIVRSLDYFADAEEDEMPEMLKKVSWEKVKEFFQEQAINLAKDTLKF